MRRLRNGSPLRKAMQESGLDIPRLVEATQRVDIEGKGLSRAMIGFIVGEGKSARDDCSDRAAEIIAAALGRPIPDLFADTSSPSSVVAESTSTPRMQMQTRDSAVPAQLMDQRQLCAYLQKSSSWVDGQITRTRGLPEEQQFPVTYVGRSRRFDPREVLDHLAKQRAQARTRAA